MAKLHSSEGYLSSSEEARVRFLNRFDDMQLAIAVNT